MQNETFSILLTAWLMLVIAIAAPGPNLIAAASTALGHGRRPGLMVVAGIATGTFIWSLASSFGVAAIFTLFPPAFLALKLAGGAYLVWLGIQLWRSKPELAIAPAGDGRREKTRMFANAYVVTALNPKGIVFFVAFVPQFIDPARPLLQQFVILVTTFVILGAVNAAFWAVMAGTMRSRFSSPSALRLVNRLGGSAMIGAGLLTAMTRRAAG